MDTRLLRPKGMNGLKIRSSTRLLVQINLPTRHQPSCRRLQHLLEGLESRHLESRPKTEARLVLEVSAGWASSSSHVLGVGDAVKAAWVRRICRPTSEAKSVA
jgi:hypothetical protein